MTRLALLPLMLTLGGTALAQTAPDAPAAGEAPVEAPLPPAAPAAPAAPEAPPDPASLPTEFEADDRVTFDEPRNDVFGLGETVRIQAMIADNALMVGRDVLVEAPVEGDVFGMGETIRVSSVVLGDLYAMGGKVILDEGAVVQGNIYALSGDVTIEGDVGHDVSAGAGAVRIAGAIGGDVDVGAGELQLLEGAAIAGDLDYETPNPVDNAEEFVGGEVTYTKATDDQVTIDAEAWEPEEEDDDSTLVGAFAWWSVWRVIAYGTTVLLGLVILAVGGPAASRVGRMLREKPGESIGVGFATLMLLPPMALVCVAMVVPSLLGVVGMLAWILLVLVARVFVAQALGDWMLRQWRPEAVGNPIVSMAVGLIPLVVLFGLPWLGGLAHIAVASLGMGAVLWATHAALKAAEA